MIIKEGSILEIHEGFSDGPIIENIEVNSDIEIENNGNGYTFLLRTEGYEENSIFESEKIIKKRENEYIVFGFFKDALLVVDSKNDKKLYESYLDDWLKCEERNW